MTSTKSQRICRYAWPRPKRVEVWTPAKRHLQGLMPVPGAGVDEAYQPSDADVELLRRPLESMPLTDQSLARFAERFGVFGVRNPYESDPGLDTVPEHLRPYYERLPRIRFAVLEYRAAVGLHTALAECDRGEKRGEQQLRQLVIGRSKQITRVEWKARGWELLLSEPEGMRLDPEPGTLTEGPKVFHQRDRGGPFTSMLPDDASPVLTPSRKKAARALLARLIGARRWQSWAEPDWDGDPSSHLVIGSALGCAWWGLAGAVSRKKAFRCVECGAAFTGSLLQSGDDPLYCSGPEGACSQRAKRRRAEPRKLKKAIKLKAEGLSVSAIAKKLKASERKVRSWTEE